MSLLKPQRSGERAGLVRDALHEAAVADEHVGAVVDDRVAGPVELRGEELLGERHADRVGEALAERAGRRLDAGRGADLGMARRLRVQLPEALELLDRKVVAGQVQQRVEQHRAVAVGQRRSGRGPATADWPDCGAGAVPHSATRDLRHAHRHARVTGLRGFDRVHRQRANRVGEFPVGGDSGGGHGGSDSVEGRVEAAEYKSRHRTAATIDRAVPRCAEHKIIALAHALCNNPKALQRSNPKGLRRQRSRGRWAPFFPRAAGAGLFSSGPPRGQYARHLFQRGGRSKGDD